MELGTKKVEILQQLVGSKWKRKGKIRRKQVKQEGQEKKTEKRQLEEIKGAQIEPVRMQTAGARQKKDIR